MKPCIVLLAISLTGPVSAQDTIIPLWPEEVPNRVVTGEQEIQEKTDILRISRVQEPSIAVYLAFKSQRHRESGPNISRGRVSDPCL